MRSRSSFNVLLMAVSLVLATAAVARAAEPAVEIGASLASATIGLGDNNGSTFGVPSSGFGIFNPGVYASIFLGPHLAVEPQIGLVWASSEGESEHVLNATGQVDYFIRPISEPSVYVFGAVGVIEMSGGGPTPKSAGGGVGYRIPLGDRLTVRMDGRVTHFTEGGGNTTTFTLSIGGLFGRR